jgi:hypothetical protein
MRKRPKDNPHVRLYFYMLESKAWNSISPFSHDLYIKILKEHRGRSENKFKLPYSQSGQSPATTAKCLKELVKWGFIKILEHGGLFHQCNIYSLSTEWQKHGQHKKNRK